MTDETDFATELDNLALALMKDAAKDTTPMPQRLEIFKLCSQHHVNLKKLRGKTPPTDEDRGDTMASLRDGVIGATPAPADPGGDDNDEADDSRDA